jgi:DNA-binding NarL/FixJ family response regulator
MIASAAKGIRVAIADDHDLFRDGLRAVLDAAEDISVVGDAGDGAAAQELVFRSRPDVLLLDVEMPGPPALSTVSRIAAECQSTRVLIVTMHRDRVLANQLMNAGAAGFLSKVASSAELVTAVRHVSAAPRSLPTRAAGPPSVLTAREREVLRLVATGRSNSDIAARLTISVGTVKRHNSQIFAKLGAHSRTDAVQRARRLGELT